MKNKKIKYKDLCQIVQEQKDKIKELEQTIDYIQNNYFCNIPFQAKIVYSYSPYCAEELRISYLKNGKVNVHGISTIFNINDTQKAFDDTINNRILKAYIKIGE